MKCTTCRRKRTVDAQGLCEPCRARLDRYVADTVAKAPPLTQAQRDRLAVLLRGAQP